MPSKITVIGGFTDKKTHRKELRFNIEKIIIEPFTGNDIQLNIARLDKLHDVVSGNKIFKLAMFMQEAQHSKSKTIVTFGGPYSNHLVATAFQCNLLGFESIGLVRGEAPKKLSDTLKDCIKYGMKLEFLSREDYENKNAKASIDRIKSEYSNALIIPEGGYDNNGAKGAAMILDHVDKSNYTHVCTPVGTATTLAGLVMNADTYNSIIGFSVLKNLIDIKIRLQHLLGTDDFEMPVVMNDYHFGGYAKKNGELIQFMNSLYADFQIPTDFVYTGKMMFGIFDLLKKGYFKKGSNILCLHTGGLQGNRSLPEGTLVF